MVPFGNTTIRATSTINAHILLWYMYLGSISIVMLTALEDINNDISNHIYGFIRHRRISPISASATENIIF